jgi:aspartate/methionine/tyrosine aminotransferase
LWLDAPLLPRGAPQGQGWPDFGASPVARAAACAAIADDADGARLNQYTTAAGLPALSAALSEYYRVLHGWRLDPATEARAHSLLPYALPK